MALYQNWLSVVESATSQEQEAKFWQAYFKKEQYNYEYILAHTDEVYEGTVAELATKFDMDAVTFAGFLYGINTSLTEELDVEGLEENTPVSLSIDFEKLYFNMLDAKADWLYTLPQWEPVLTVEKRKEIKKAYNESKIVRKEAKIGRNEPCPCGSGKKYKQCCLNK